MIPARLRTVLLIAVVVGVTGWAVLDVLEATGAASVRAPWTAAVAVGLLAVVVLVAGLDVRRWVAGRRERPLDPLTAARVAVLAKAAAYTGGGLAGWHLAQAAVLFPDLVGARRTRFLLVLLSVLASVGLAAAGLLAQRWCRRPPDDEDGSPGERTPTAT
ncbi:MAG: hypothetical protein QG622_327 [Actinomycetota bacterium]|nr:hypothetical protein [Actinomycetota bacterium]